MKNLLCRLIFAALIVAAVQLCSVSVVAQSYPLVCRGDKHALIQASDEPQGVSLTFKKGSAAVASGLAPGECSWLDRGLSAAEPDILVQPTRQLRADEVAVSAEHKWTDDLKDPEKYWTFDVYNDRKGQLIVTGSHKGNAAGSEAAKALAKALKTPLYELYKAFSDSFYLDSFYTPSLEEKGYALGLGFHFCGVVGYVLKTQLPGTVPLHRLYKDHIHLLTTDEEEKGYLKGLGYAYDGVLGYVSKTPLPGTNPLYLAFGGSHCYETKRAFEVEAYVWTSP
jgi:hypothetical protein